MIKFLREKLKGKLLKTGINIVKGIIKKAATLIILGIAIVYFVSEIKLWAKNESQKILNKSISSGINKINPAPNKIKEKLQKEILEKDMVILKKEMERLKNDFKKRDQWLIEIEKKYNRFRSKIYKDDTNKNLQR